MESNISFQEDLNKLSKIFLKPKELNGMRKLIEELFTPNEIKDLILRIKLLEMLNNNISQRTISKDLNISLCKITRGSRILKEENSMIKEILKEMNTKQD